jgi:hypothetical protein
LLLITGGSSRIVPHHCSSARSLNFFCFILVPCSS